MLHDLPGMKASMLQDIHCGPTDEEEGTDRYGLKHGIPSQRALPAAILGRHSSPRYHCGCLIGTSMLQNSHGGTGGLGPVVQDRSKMHSAFQMLDLPLPWLAQFVATVRERESKLCLFGACQQLRNLILAEADDIQCLLDVSQVFTAQAARSLGLLAGCKEAAKKQLVLQDSATDSAALCAGKAADFSSWLTQLCIRHSSVLEAITHVEFKAHVCGGIVPPELKQLFPNLTHFTRLGWFCVGPNPTYVDVSPCPQLQHLTILNLLAPDVDLYGYSHGDGDRSVCGLTEDEMWEQFSTLPNLQSLHCVLSSDEEDQMGSDAERLSQQARWASRTAFFQRTIGPLSSHLQSLTMITSHSFHGASVSDLFGQTWPQLQHVKLRGFGLQEKAVKLVLEHMPQIKDLDVTFLRVWEHWRERTREPMKKCTWQHLTAHVVDTTALALLPVPGLSTLRAARVLLAQMGIDHMHEDIAALARIRSVQGISKPIQLGVAGNLHVDETQVPQLVAVLQALQQDHYDLHCFSGKLHPLWLHALRQVQCRALTVCVHALPEGCWDTLLQQLPHLQVLHLQAWREHTRRSNTSITQLATFCRLASRPCTLRMSGDGYARIFGQDWYEQLMSVMHAAGHQHVHIEVVPE